MIRRKNEFSSAPFFRSNLKRSSKESLGDLSFPKVVVCSAIDILHLSNKTPKKKKVNLGGFERSTDCFLGANTKVSEKGKVRGIELYKT